MLQFCAKTCFATFMRMDEIIQSSRIASSRPLEAEDRCKLCSEATVRRPRPNRLAWAWYCRCPLEERSRVCHRATLVPKYRQRYLIQETPPLIQKLTVRRVCVIDLP